LKRHYTITDLLSAYSEGLSVRDYLHSVWTELQEAGVGPSGDPAVIYCADWDQIDIQIRKIEQSGPQTLPLFGIPFVVKDNIDVQGWPTTAACPSFKYIAESTATVVRQLQVAGAVVMAKTNLDQFATGLVGTRSPYGPVPNPFDKLFISGGSSSGSASLVSRGKVCFALGTDTAGSGRIPAGFCNVVGAKPSPGLVSTQGVVPACRTLDVVSLFALTVDDASYVLPIMEATSVTRQAEPQFHAPPSRTKLAFQLPLRVGVPSKPIFESSEYEDAYSAAVEQARGLGWNVVEFDMSPLQKIAALLYEGPWVSERYSVIKGLLDECRHDLNVTVAEVISRGANFSATDAFSAIYELRELAVEAEKIFQNVDVLLLPTAPLIPRLDEIQADPIGLNSKLGTYTNFVNLLSWSALALPASITLKGLPFGVTLVGQTGCDYALLSVGQEWQESVGLPVGQHLGSASSRRNLTGVRNVSSCGTLSIAVVGAHLQDMPLHWQVRAAGARLRSRCRTSASYRLFSLDGVSPPKPGLQRVSEAGKSIEVEVYDFPLWAVGDFLASIPHPLGLGNIELSDGTWVKGFICEQIGLTGAIDITEFGGWRSFVESRD